MQEIIVHFSDYAPYLAYIGIFTMLILCGMGLPVPEESILIAGGYLAGSGVLNNYISIALCFLGVLGGDYVLFMVGRRWGVGALGNRYLRWVFTPRRLVRVRKHFRRHGDKTVFAARFFSGLRVATFLTAGMMKMKSGTFLVIDALAALISVPLFYLLGFFLHDHIESLFRAVKDFNHLLLLLVLLILLGYLMVYRRWTGGKKR